VTTPTRGLRASINSFVPNWLSNRLGLNNGFKILYTIALIFDAILTVCLQGIRATFPGFGTPTALPILGQARGLIMWLNETNEHYAARLINFRNTWANAGSTELLAQLIQGYLGTNPVVRIVNRGGLFVTANADGTTSVQVDTNWDWDSTSNPEREFYWSDIWIIISPSPYTVTFQSFTDPNWVLAWGGATGGGIGHNAPRVQVSNLLQLISTWKGAHTYVRAIIWTTDTTLFVPGNLTITGNPNGTWGNWCFETGGNSLPSRTRVTSLGTVRYWTPPNGG
jgi:hypothetical protein